MSISFHPKMSNTGWVFRRQVSESSAKTLCKFY